MNLLILIYVGHTRPLISRFSNKIESLNELIVCSCSFFIPLFAEYTNVERQFNNGWILLAFLFIMLVCNVFIILYFGTKSICLVLVKYYKKVKNSIYRKKINEIQIIEEKGNKKTISLPQFRR